MEREQESDLWAVVLTTAGKYLCRLTEFTVSDKDGALEAFKEGKVMAACPIYDLNVQMIPIPTPEGLQIQREVNASPFILSLDDTTPAYLKPMVMQFFCDMKPADLTRYKRLVDQASRLAQSARLQESGIALAGADEMPPEGRGSA